MTHLCRLLLVPAFVLSLAGCAQNTRASISVMVQGDASELNHYQHAAREFQRQNPLVDVHVAHVPAALDYRTKLAAMFAAGTPPDLFFLNYQRLAPFVAANQIQPVEQMLVSSRQLTEGDFYIQALNPLRFDGRLMCLPTNLSSPVIYFNKAIFDRHQVAYPRAGWRWDQFEQAAQATTSASSGQTDSFGFGTEIQLFRLAPFIWSNGGELIRPDATAFALDDPLTLQAVQRYVELRTRLQVAPSQRAERTEDSLTRFASGRLAMYMDSRRVVPAFRAVIGEKFDWDVAPLPSMGQPVSILHSDAMCMSASTRDKPAAWKFMELAFDARFQAALAETGRTVPAMPQIAESPAFLAPNTKPANSRVWLDAIPTLRTVPQLKHWAAIESAFNKELEAAYYGLTPVSASTTAVISQTKPLFAK